MKSIHLTGVWLNNKLYRPSEYNILLNLNNSIKAKPILIFKQLINTLKTSLSLKNLKPKCLTFLNFLNFLNFWNF
jgi:hypothetical protein